MLEKKELFLSDMNNKSILLIDPEFDPEHSESLDLLVKIGADSFSYAIIDPTQKLVYALYDEQECEDGYRKLNDRLKADSYLKLAYKNVKIAAHTQDIVFVPNVLFDAESASVNAGYFNTNDSQFIYAQPCDQHKFTTVFALPKTAETVINDRWPESKKLPITAGLQNIVALCDQDTLILDFTVKSFQALYVKQEQVVFQQFYEFEGVEELTYYLLLITNQLQIDSKNTALKVCGIVHEGDEIWNRLKVYFENLSILSISTPLNTTILEDMPKHYYTNLLSLYTCG